MLSQVVYIARNPKDVIVSYYYHYKLVKWHDHIGGIESFARRFMQDQGDSINFENCIMLFHDYPNCRQCCIRRFSRTFWTDGREGIIPMFFSYSMKI